MTAIPLTRKNVTGMEKLKTQVRVSGCRQRSPRSLLQSFPFQPVTSAMWDVFNRYT